jgi:hypothetical protein
MLKDEPKVGAIVRWKELPRCEVEKVEAVMDAAKRRDLGLLPFWLLLRDADRPQAPTWWARPEDCEAVPG